MRWYDIFILVLIALYCAYVIFAKKKGGCCSDCSKCQGCGQKKKQ